MGSRVGSTGISYRVLPDAPSSGESNVLESIYALAIEKSEEQEKAGGTNAGEDDPKGPDKHDRADNQSIQEACG